eukprot:4544904-Pyramimonas_sp.AAC.1
MWWHRSKSILRASASLQLRRQLVVRHCSCYWTGPYPWSSGAVARTAALRSSDTVTQLPEAPP